jgi:hypothetical protein
MHFFGWGFNRKMKAKFGHVGVQLTVRDSLVVDPGPHLKAAMNEAVKSCSLSRSQIVDDMNRRALICGIRCNGKSQKVTEAILDKWLAPGSDGHHIPLRLLHLFCQAVGSNLPLEVYARAFCGVRVVSEEEYKILEWAKAEIDIRKARKRSRRIAQEVGIE